MILINQNICGILILKNFYKIGGGYMGIKRKLSAILLSFGVFSGILGSQDILANHVEEQSIVFSQDMGNQIANERLNINKDESNSSVNAMYHYSHRSHSSHSSHSSHTSHYSSYY